METFQESSIWEGRITEESTFIPGSFIIGSGHIGSGQINSSHVSSAQIGFPQVSKDQLGPNERSATQINSNETSFGQIGLNELTPNQFGATEVAATHIVSTKVRLTPIAFSQNRPSDSLSHWVIDLPPSSSTQISISEFNAIEISFSSSTLLQEFISSYFSESHSASIQNTSVPTWLEFLQGTTLFNLNIEIADLPTDPPAEANITGSDPTGRPNAGTLYLDTDANGLGWFSDLTPWDNIEFSQTLADTAYRATPDSLAYNHYDHPHHPPPHETGHLQGFISGYSNCDRHIQTQNGSKTPGLSEVDTHVDLSLA